MLNILSLPGSARRDSVNRKLAAVAAELVTEAGAAARLVDPADFPLPLFDSDLEAAEGLPAAAKALKQDFLDAYGKFDDSGKPVDSSVRDGVKAVVAEVLAVAAKLK